MKRTILFAIVILVLVATDGRAAETAQQTGYVARIVEVARQWWNRMTGSGSGAGREQTSPGAGREPIRISTGSGREQNGSGPGSVQDQVGNRAQAPVQAQSQKPAQVPSQPQKQGQAPGSGRSTEVAAKPAIVVSNDEGFWAGARQFLSRIWSDPGQVQSRSSSVPGQLQSRSRPAPVPDPDPGLSNFPSVAAAGNRAEEASPVDDKRLESLAQRARRLVAQLPVMAPVAIQPAISPAHGRPSPEASSVPILKDVKTKKPVPAVQPIVAAREAVKPRARYAPREKAEPVDPTKLAFHRESKPAELAKLVLEKVDPLQRDTITLLTNLFAWLLGRSDEALTGLHGLGQATKIAALREKAFAYEGWILEEGAQKGLASLAFWRALDAAVNDDQGYADAVARSLSTEAADVAVAKSAPAEKAVERAASLKGLGPEARAFLTLELASRAYDRKAYDRARKLAQSVPAKTSWKDFARYLAATSLVAGKEDNASLTTAGRELTELFRTVDDARLFDATAVTLGRIHFILGNYNASHQYLIQASRDTNLFIDAAVDNAWALLRQGDRNHAVGNMFTLHTPYFDGAYMPESFFLQSLGYQEICQFGDALTSVKQFKVRYNSAYAKLIEFNSAGKAPDTAYYDDLVAYLSHRDPKLPGIVLRELGRHPQFLRRQKELNRLTREQTTVATTFPTAAPKINEWLGAEIKGIHDSEIATIGKFLKARSLEMQEELKFLTANVSLLEYEVYAGAGSNLSLQGAQNFAVDEKKALPKRSFEEGKEYWPYEDEIWEDELNNFRSKMVDGCAKIKKGGDDEAQRAPAGT